MRTLSFSRLLAAAAATTSLLLVPATAAAAATTVPAPPDVQERTSFTPDFLSPPGWVRPQAITDPGYTLNLGTDGSPIRWNPCQAIHYRVNAADGGPGALDDVTAAIAQLSASSGLQFVYDGPSTDIPQSGYGRGANPASPPPLLIAWAAPGTGPGRSDLLTDGGEVGNGGWVSMSWTGADGVAHPMQIVSGLVVLKSSATVAPGFGPANMTTRGRLLLHELGHAVGLNHTTDGNQVMYPVVDGRAGSYANGDRAGLARVGAAAGCIGGGTPPVVTNPPGTGPVVTPLPTPAAPVDPFTAFWQWLMSLLRMFFPWL